MSTTPPITRTSTATDVASSDRLTGLAAGLDDPVPPDAARLAHYVAECFGPEALAVIHYGSRAQGSGARPESAHDFFVIVDRYDRAYRALHAAVGTHYSPGTAAALARVLPPNVIAISTRPVVDRVTPSVTPSVTPKHTSPPAVGHPPGAGPLRAKCAVLSLRHLQRLCSRAAKDHFTRGRLFQQVQLVWTRDRASASAVTEALLSARRVTYDWGRPYLPRTFDVDAYCRTLLETSFAAEIRPEGGDRVTQLLAAQRDTLVQVYSELLQQLAAQNLVTSEGNVYGLRRPAGPAERLRSRLWFARSKLRATLRWLKHVWLYAGWLEYIVQKVARRTGETIELTERERRWPLIFLWPKVIRFVAHRPQRRSS